jgi:methyl-accepting chemotaxis protein
MLDVLVKIYNQMGFLGSLITGLIIAVFIAGFYVNLLVRRRYISLSVELAAFCAGDITEFRSEMLAWVSEEYKASLNSGIEAINTTAIMEMAVEAYQKTSNLGESFLKKVNGLLVTLGLFGTFLGLTTAIGNIGNMMAETSAEQLMTEAGINTFKVLVSSFQGMSVAFITSLFGTGFSILYTIINSFTGSGDTKKLFMTQLEEYLDVKLASEAMDDKIKHGLEHKDEIDSLCNTLTGSISTFNDTVRHYADELQSLKSFNHEFSRNLGQAHDSVALLVKAMDKTSETVYQSGVQIFNCSEELKYLVNEIRDENHRMEGMSGVLTELSQKLNDSTKDRQIFLKVLSEVPDKLLNYSEAAVARIERGR